MKAVNIAVTNQTTSSPSTWLRKGVRTAIKAVGWAILMLVTLLAGYFSGGVLTAIRFLGRAPLKDVITVWLILLAFTVGLSLLVAKFLASLRSVGWTVGTAIATILIAMTIWGFAYPDQALYFARQITWGESTLKDYELFPERAISNAAPAFHFQQNYSPELFQTIEYRSNGELKHMALENFLQSTQTTSFIILKDDILLYEGYFNGYKRDSIVTSFSMAKSITSALIGIAIDEGYIKSVNDRMIDYIPELKGKGLDGVTIRDLLLMSAGIRFLTDDESPTWGEFTQFTDEGLCYSYPNIRSLALKVKPDGKAPGDEFNYNNYHPMLLGIILERATGRRAAEYLQEKIWKPLGMEYAGSWSLDSEKDGFELMQSGVNGRAIDFAKFGRLFLDEGNWNGTQVISKAWVREATSPDPQDQRAWHPNAWFDYWKEKNGYYKYQWWGRVKADGSYDYAAMGHLGQWIYVAPQEKMVILRFGLEEGGVDDWADVFQSLIAKVSGKME